MIPWAVIDCETDPFRPDRLPEPFLWGFYDGSAFETFRTTEEAANRIAKFRGRIYAHNGGKFDYHFLAPWIDTGHLMVINGRLARCRLGRASLRDSFNLMPVPLSAYQKTEINYDLFEPELRERPTNARLIRDYLRDDCVFLYELLERYRADYPDALTLAGAAMKVWAGMGGFVPRTNRTFYDRMVRWYYGGRVEVFHPGIHGGKFQVADIKSAYPYAMLHAHPISELPPRVVAHVPDSEIEQCFFTIEGNPRGAFPFRNQDGSISYPSRKGVYHVTGWEFRAALETGALTGHRVVKAIKFARYGDFGPYVEHFYAEKARCEKMGDKAGYLISKLFLNSFYGKFAAAPHRYRNWRLGEWGENIPTSGKLHERASDLFGDRQLYSSPIPEQQMRYYNVATAASITGFVRAYLWLSINEVSNCHYCDTDSVIAQSADTLRYGSNLGEWELEAEPDELAIAGKKLYAYFRGGIPLKARSKGVKLSAAEIRAVAAGGTVTYRPEVPTFSLTTGRNFIPRTVRATT